MESVQYRLELYIGALVKHDPENEIVGRYDKYFHRILRSRFSGYLYGHKKIMILSTDIISIKYGKR